MPGSSAGAPKVKVKVKVNGRGHDDVKRVT
jgi:hypothetical protein